jgi:DNA invertase Pin-like site-specific DNA recombinase
LVAAGYGLPLAMAARPESEVPMKCAIWARVSDDHQSTEAQLADLRRWAGNRGLDIVAEYVVDAKSAYKGDHLADLDRALDGARLGEYDVLLVWALDRLSREGVGETLNLLKKFHGYGVAVWSHQESWLSGDPHMAELLTSLFAWMAHQESVRRSERIKSGLAKRKEAGKPVGRKAGAKDAKPRRKAGYRGNTNAARREPAK